MMHTIHYTGGCPTAVCGSDRSAPALTQAVQNFLPIKIIISTPLLCPLPMAIHLGTFGFYYSNQALLFIAICVG
jgi:hypothetical protein